MREDDQLVDEIIADAMRRRETGESLSDADVVAAHPQHADRLSECLGQLQLITAARKQVELAATTETVVIAAGNAGDSFTTAVCPVCGITRDPSGNLSDDGGACPHCGSSLSDSEGLFPGKKIRQYMLVEQIGRGGFGSVWRARDTKLECDVAIKIPLQSRHTAVDIERFIREEARNSARLRKHANIVTVHEADWEDETAFIVSDLIDGVSLGDRLKERRLSLDECVRLMTEVCGALHHAHTEGITHRDLKPDNILLDREDVPHVTDFGLARQDAESTDSEAGLIVGTAAYMSPEQARGASNQADCRSDVYSLGVVVCDAADRDRSFDHHRRLAAQRADRSASEQTDNSG